MPPTVFILMGVSATGKTTLGLALADATDGTFIDGDDYHPEANVRKMHAGLPLNDEDRLPWLKILAGLVAEKSLCSSPTFIACSALKESYREILRSKYPPLVFLLLSAPEEVLYQRIKRRFESGEHFMPPSLLASQFETLEIPDYALELDVTKSVSELVGIFQRRFPHLENGV